MVLPPPHGGMMISGRTQCWRSRVHNYYSTALCHTNVRSNIFHCVTAPDWENHPWPGNRSPRGDIEEVHWPVSTILPDRVATQGRLLTSSPLPPSSVPSTGYGLLWTYINDPWSHLCFTSSHPPPSVISSSSSSQSLRQLVSTSFEPTPFFFACLDPLHPFPTSAVQAAAISWHILVLAACSWSILSLSSLCCTTSSAVYTRSLPWWRWSFATMSVISLAPERRNLTISSHYSVSARAPWSDCTSWPLRDMSFRKQSVWQSNSCIAVRASGVTGLGFGGVFVWAANGKAMWCIPRSARPWFALEHFLRGQMPDPSSFEITQNGVVCVCCSLWAWEKSIRKVSSQINWNSTGVSTHGIAPS